MRGRLVAYVLIISSLFSVYSQKSIVISAGEKESYIVKTATPIVKEMYARLDMNVEFNYSAFERSLLQSNSGVTDGELVRVGNISETFPNLVKVPESLFKLDQVAFSIKEFGYISRMQDLKPYKLTYIRGAKHFEKLTIGYNSVPADSTEKAFRLLLYGRVDFVLISYKSGIDYLKNSEIVDYYYSEPISSVYLYHYVHKTNEYLVPRLKNALIAIKSGK